MLTIVREEFFKWIYLFYLYSWWITTKQKKKAKGDYFLDYLCYSVLPGFHSLFSIFTPSCWPHLISHYLILLLNKSIILPTFISFFTAKGVSVFPSTKDHSSVCALKPFPLTLHTILLFSFFSPSFLWQLCHYNSIFWYLQPLCKREAKEKKYKTSKSTLSPTIWPYTWPIPEPTCPENLSAQLSPILCAQSHFDPTQFHHFPTTVLKMCLSRSPYC